MRVWRNLGICVFVDREGLAMKGCSAFTLKIPELRGVEISVRHLVREPYVRSQSKGSFNVAYCLEAKMGLRHISTLGLGGLLIPFRMGCPMLVISYISRVFPPTKVNFILGQSLRTVRDLAHASSHGGVRRRPC